jgi:hypothetical protein
MVQVKKTFSQKQREKEELSHIVMKKYHKARKPAKRPEMSDIFEKASKK